MKTANEMINYVLENGFGEIANKDCKSFDLIEQTLNDDEVVIMAFSGLHNVSKYAFAITKDRLIMAKKRTINFNVKTILLKHLTNVTFKSNFKFGTITFSTLHSAFEVELRKKQAIILNDALQHVIMQLNNTFDATQTQNSDNATSSIEEIKKLKELLDLEAISEKEYEEKKQQLLARI